MQHGSWNQNICVRGVAVNSIWSLFRRYSGAVHSGTFCDCVVGVSNIVVFPVFVGTAARRNTVVRLLFAALIENSHCI